MARAVGLRQLPPWRPAWQAYATALELLQWLGGPDLERASADAARMLARDWAHRHRRVLSLLGMDLSDSRDRLVEEQSGGFESTVMALAAWIGDSV